MERKMPKEIVCPDCEGFGYLHDKNTKKNRLCKTCFGYKVIKDKTPGSSRIWDTT
jgi:DnaJ-class molecular chaperone